ncbi:MAG TPA: YceD family protein [Verrucomicrobiae bacterium]|nr:YceD family protein [Verrucomicrobiae bacterium]
MPVKVNLRHIEDKSVHLEGEIASEELEFVKPDEMIEAKEPLEYQLEVEQSGQNLLVHGILHLSLDCECVRCLRPFKCTIDLDPYDALVPLEGEDRAVVINDLVDLTPYLREDILLAFPQHPLCEAECDRVPKLRENKSVGTSAQSQKSAWDELNKLKLK